MKLTLIIKMLLLGMSALIAETELTLTLAEDPETASDILSISMPELAENNRGPFYYYIYASHNLVEWKRSKLKLEVGYGASGPYFSFRTELLENVDYLDDYWNLVIPRWESKTIEYYTQAPSFTSPVSFPPRGDSQFYRVEQLEEN